MAEHGEAPATTHKNLVPLSKAMAWVLRHGARQCGLRFQHGGFLSVEDVLSVPRCRGFTVQDVRDVVARDDKKRFALKDSPTGGLLIRANQGHTLEVDGLELTPITLRNADDFPTVIHGTNRAAWNSIKTEGLSRRNRTHIHFAPGVSSDDGVISGIPRGTDVLIYLDLKSALKDGIEFSVSANRVILSPGDREGFIKPRYFREVRDRITGQCLKKD